MRKLYGAAFALIVLLSVTMSAVALTSKTIYRQNGVSAYADWTKTTGDLTTDTLLYVIQSDIGTDIYLSICTYDITGNGSCKSGEIITQDNVFSMDKKLDSASLKSVQIELFEWICEENGMCLQTPAGTANIEATWTATGKVSTGSYKWMSRSNDYMEKGSSSSRSRDAIATGSIVIDSDSRDLEPSNYGGLATFKSVSMQMQK